MPGCSGEVHFEPCQYDRTCRIEVDIRDACKERAVKDAVCQCGRRRRRTCMNEQHAIAAARVARLCPNAPNPLFCGR
jgi:hypothetical protein